MTCGGHYKRSDNISAPIIHISKEPRLAISDNGKVSVNKLFSFQIDKQESKMSYQLMGKKY